MGPFHKIEGSMGRGALDVELGAWRAGLDHGAGNLELETWSMKFGAWSKGIVSGA
jgi:hypothetical protein